ncbi:5'-3' exonuclease [Parahaliea mediterranea]|uniref:Flap endonuclease n=1 Tax=Parahaliea mediterranea TaxID=651086 RepID=A0A939IPA9_9GAMM|nr:5'-3' exonuclease H3TH domain-containing protein [Parahaliea mediterranea]MBN7798857.1 flap endonuclease [Parahaliea mediterranea]
MPRQAWLVDASIYIFRAWFSLPDRWTSPEGLPLNAVVGYSGFLLDLMARRGEGGPLAAAFDESLGSCFRNRIYPDYKCSRALPDEALAFQLATCRELTATLGIPCFGGPEYEADDYLASLARVCREAGLAVTLISRDKDLGQLLEKGDALWDFAADTRLDVESFRDRFGVAPSQFADYQGLVGDRIDDIPGVPGVGPRTAAQLLARYPDLDALGADLASVSELPLRGAPALRQRLQSHWPQALLSRQLARLDNAVPEVNGAPSWAAGADGLERFAARLAELGIGGRLLQRCRQLREEMA